MKKETKNTKEKIKSVATKLFSTYGYNATSIRKIAKEVGIRESAIYNHYKSKEDIFLCISHDIFISMPSPLLTENKIKDAKGYLKEYAEEFKKMTYNKTYEKLFRLLMIELLQNEQLRKNFMQNFHNQNTKILSKNFFEMMQNADIRSADPMVLAYEFLSTLFYIRLQVILLNIDNKKENFIENMFEKHVDFFWESIKL